MTTIAKKHHSWLGVYYDINRTATNRSQDNENVYKDDNSDEDLCEIDSADEHAARELKLLRIPTFYPTSTSQCENCETTNEINVTAEGTELYFDKCNDDKNTQTSPGTAIAFCQDCRISMCRRCCECHGSMKALKDHIMVPVLLNNENFIKKSFRTKKKRRKLQKYAKMCKSAMEFNLDTKGNVSVSFRKENGVMNTNDVEKDLVNCQESLKIHKHIDEKITGLTRRIDHLQNKLETCDRVIEEFCHNMLSTQISVVEIGEYIRRKIELQVDEILEQLKKETIKFCSTFEDNKEAIVNSIDELVNSRNALLEQKQKRIFSINERDTLEFLLGNVSNMQSRVMSRNRDIRQRMEISFKPLELMSCCPSIGVLEVTCYSSNSNSPYSKSANFSRVVPFKNEVRGITKFRNELAVVTANCSTIYFLDSDSFEVISTFNVKGMKNPYDLVADSSSILFITEWSDKFIHRVELPAKQQSKIATKNAYSTLSLTPSGCVLATCPLKNKAREIDVKTAKHVKIRFAKEKETLLNSNKNGSSSGGSSDEATNISQIATGITGNACHTLLIPSSPNEENTIRYLLCTSDSHLVLTNEKGMPISIYKKTFENGEPKSNQGNISISLHRPSHIAVDNEGFIYVCDSGNDRIVLLDKSLNFVKEILQPGTDGVKNPLRIFLDHEKSKLFVAATFLYVFDLF